MSRTTLVLLILRDYIYRLLTKTMIGTLGLALLLYTTSNLIFNVEPMTFGQLLMWVDQQGIETKTAILSSLLTVSGFLFAFHITSINWRKQLDAEIKLEIRSELNSYLKSICQSISNMEIIIRAILRERETLESSTEAWRIKHALDVLERELESYSRERQQLSSEGLKIYEISGINFSIFASANNAITSLQEIEESIRAIRNEMWFKKKQFSRWVRN